MSEIERLLAGEPVTELGAIAEGIANVYEVRVPGLAKQVIDLPLREIPLPEGSLIAAISRGTRAFVPGADDTVQAGDTVVVVGSPDCLDTLRKLFGA